MSDAPNVIVRSPEEFAHLVRAFQERLRNDASFAEVVTVLCGTPERAQAFTASPGVSMSTFAALLGVPASTVRHYQRLGLITPYQVNGKFRFWFHNLIQAESVRQWRDLGLSLEDIQAQRAHERLGGQTATFNALTTGHMSVHVTSKAVTVAPLHEGDATLPFNSLNPRTVWLPVAPEQRLTASRDVFRDAMSAERDWPLDLERLRAEVRAARLRLEERLRTLEEQLRRARTLEAALSPAGPRGEPPA